MRYFHSTISAIALMAILGASPLFGQGLTLDFDSNPADFGVEFFGTAEWVQSGGNPGGYLKVTDAENGQSGSITFPDLFEGREAAGFRITADLRVGGGTDSPADGFSFNFVRPNDPVIAEEPIGSGWAASPAQENNLPEEGSTTGLAIGFDEWQSGAVDPDVPAGECGSSMFDCIGMSVRIDDELISQFPFPTLNGSVDDQTSLQTGAAGAPAGELGWAPLFIELGLDGRLQITYKEVEVFNQVIDYEPSVGQLVFGGRTGGANSNHHIDNITILNLASSVIPGDFNDDGTVDLADFAIQAGNMNSPGVRTDGDMNFNRRIDLTDFFLFRAELNAQGATAAAVPEPTSALLGLSGLLGLGALRRRRR